MQTYVATLTTPRYSQPSSVRKYVMSRPTSGSGYWRKNPAPVTNGAKVVLPQPGWRKWMKLYGEQGLSCF